MTVIDDLKRSMQEKEQEMTCQECQTKYPDLDFSKRICVHTIRSNDFPGMIWRIICNQEQEMLDKFLLIKNSSNGQPHELKLTIDGIEISIRPFFQLFYQQLDDMINLAAQEKAQSIIREFENKFSALFNSARSAAKKTFPAYEQFDEDQD